MSLFYFTIVDKGRDNSVQVVDILNESDVRREAVRIASVNLHDESGLLVFRPHWRLDVTNESGHFLFDLYYDGGGSRMDDAHIVEPLAQVALAAEEPRYRSETARRRGPALFCQGCKNGSGFERPFSMAFQPIVDVVTGAIFAHEALVRGPSGEGADSILSAVDDTNRYAFDQQCRVKAIELASELSLGASGAGLSINFMPNAVYEPRACIRRTLDVATRTGFPLDRIIFEFTETEKLDTDHVQNIVRTYKEIGFKTAIDDFGAGHAGLNLLAKFQPDIVKIDMDLIRGIDQDPVKRTMLWHMLRMLEDLGIVPIGEGIETEGELNALRDVGLRLIQGYLFAKPAFEALAAPATLQHDVRLSRN